MNFIKKISAIVGLTSLLFVATSNTAFADELASLKEKGVMSIAMSGDFPPFNFVNEKNEVVGFDPDIGREIAKRMGMKVEIVTTQWAGILAGLLAEKYDSIVGSMSITEKRKRVVDFVGPYYTVNRAVFVKKGSNIKTLADLDGKKIGSTLGETHISWIKEHKSWRLTTYKGLSELLLDLESGRIDAFVNDDVPVLVAIKKNNIDARKVNIANLPALGAGLAIRKGNPELKAAMQKALDAMLEDGTYAKISLKWIGSDIR